MVHDTNDSSAFCYAGNYHGNYSFHRKNCRRICSSFIYSRQWVSAPESRSIFHKILESGGTLTIQMYLSTSKAEYDVAFGIALVL